MAASPRNHYSPSQWRHQQPRGGGSFLLRLLKYLAAGLGVYALGFWHGAGQTPTVPAAASSTTAAAAAARDGSGTGSRLRSAGGVKGERRIPPIEQEELRRQKGWSGSVWAIGAVPANHDADDLGRFIEKHVMLPPASIPAITGFSRAVLKPTQIVQRHSHATMHELFYVVSGRGVFMIDDLPHVVANGSFVHLPPREPHAVLNSAKEGPDLELLYFGVAVDRR